MFNSMFSIFDHNFSFMKMSLMIPFIISMSALKMKKEIMKMMSTLFLKEIKSNNPNKTKNLNKIIYSTFIMFMMINFTNFVPYTFIWTSMISFNTSIAVLMWMSMIAMSMKMFPKNFLIKLTPPGTPNFLMPPMVLIEMTSIFIRPITLTMRISANMISGHLLMFLLSKMFILNPIKIFMSMIILSLLEVSMALIQAFIIMNLLSLFASEIK